MKTDTLVKLDQQLRIEALKLAIQNHDGDVVEQAAKNYDFLRDGKMTEGETTNFCSEGPGITSVDVCGLQSIPVSALIHHLAVKERQLEEVSVLALHCSESQDKALRLEASVNAFADFLEEIGAISTDRRKYPAYCGPLEP